MTDLLLYPVDDPQDLLPDANTYTCMLQYRTPGTLPASGRFASCPRSAATQTSPAVPEQFSIVQANGDVWTSTDRKLFYDVLTHSKVFSRESRGEMFMWLCNTSRLNSYFFVVVHQLYATIDDDYDENGVNSIEDSINDIERVVLQSCLKRRAERRRRQGKTKPLIRASLHNGVSEDDDDIVAVDSTPARDPCGSLVSIYLNDPEYTSLVQNKTNREELFVATMAFEKWYNLMRTALHNDENGENSKLLLEPPDVFTHMPLKRSLYDRSDVRFRLRLYDFQSRTAHWMKRIEDDESGIEHCLPLKSSKEEWLGSANTCLQYCSAKHQLVVGRPLESFPYSWLKSLSGDVGASNSFALQSISQKSHYIPQNERIADRLLGDGKQKSTRLQETIKKRKDTSVSIRGGVICDATGTGKTVETLGLISLQATSDKSRISQTARNTKHYAGLPHWRLPPNSLSTNKKGELYPYYFCAATLVVCPKQVCQQWIDQLAKACGEKSFRALLIMKSEDARKVSLADILHHYDIVVINKSVFSQVRYREIVVRIPEAVVERMGWNESSNDSTFPSMYRTGPYEYTLKNDYVTADNYNANGFFENALRKLLALNHAATIQAPDLAPPGSFFPHFHANLCFWARVVFDEVHELDKRWRLVERAACDLRSRIRWGLTATPTFNSAQSFGVGVQGGYLSLMRMRQDQQRNFRRSINRWQFVQKYTRRSGFVGMVPLHVHRVEVQMTPQEMAIYQSLDSVTPITLLEFCCHHDISDDAWLRSFLPARIYRRHFDPTYVTEGLNDADTQIEPHTVEEIATAMQSARQKQIESLEDKTQNALSRWMSQEERFAEFVEQAFGKNWSTAYRSSMWWLETFRPPSDESITTTKQITPFETSEELSEHEEQENKTQKKSASLKRKRNASDQQQVLLKNKKTRVATAKQKLLAKKDAAETDEEKKFVLVEEHRENRRTVRRQIFAFLNNFGAASSMPSRIDDDDNDDEEDSTTNTEPGEEAIDNRQEPQNLATKRARLMKHADAAEQIGQAKSRVGERRSRFTALYTSQSSAFKVLERDLETLDRVRRQHKYYESIFDMLNNENSITCAICLDDIPRSETVLTQCGHQFCMDCIDACGNDRVRSERQRLQSELLRGRSVNENEMTIRCAQCRTQLRVLHDLKVIDRTATVAASESDAKQQEKETTELLEKDDAMVTDPKLRSNVMREDYSRYGSKIKTILENIWTIQGLPDAKKIIVFAQSHHLLHLIGRALDSFGLPFVYVEGRNSQRNIDRFRKEERIRVILLSSEERKGSRSTISGLDLPEANYIIAAHPPMGSDEACYQTMKQAIGRVRRIGQTSDCHLLVMTTRNTIEEALYDNWHTYAQQRDRECGEGDRQEATVVSISPDVQSS